MDESRLDRRGLRIVSTITIMAQLIAAAIVIGTNLAM